MPYLVNKEALTFDDVLLVPQFSKIKSRSDVDISTPLFNHYSLSLPIVSANMDTVTEYGMAIKMAELGGMGILHRYATQEAVVTWMYKMHEVDACPIVPSIGIGPDEVNKGERYWREGADAICIDIAHGDCQGMLDTIKELKIRGIARVIAGNVATADAFMRLAKAGADVIKVGIGPGSLCTTRIVTGHGVPQLTAIKDCNMARTAYPKVKMIADGGIRNSGDIVKALAFGADAVMVGSLLAGTTESPGEVIVPEGEKACPMKEYRGMASREARATQADVSNYTPEGEAMLVPFKGSMEPIVKNLAGGVRSGFSYSGASNLEELREFSRYCIISANSLAENGAHGKRS